MVSEGGLNPVAPGAHKGTCKTSYELEKKCDAPQLQKAVAAMREEMDHLYDNPASLRELRMTLEVVEDAE
jgi:hypothetical protein